MTYIHDTRTMSEKFRADPRTAKIYNREGLLIEITELICEVIQEKEISRKELARKMGKKKKWLNDILNGTRYISIKTVSDIFFAIDKNIELKVDIK